MASSLRESTVALLRRSRLGARLVAPLALLGRNGYCHETGWMRSAVERVPVDHDGNPIPWLAYPAIEFLQARIDPGWRVFEFGSGNSTLWWAERVAEVVAVEHYEPWFERMAPRVPGNVRLQLRSHHPVGLYADSPVTSGGRFHVLVIDGRERVACARSAPPALRPDGVIVFDNTDRDRYRPGLEAMAQAGFRRIDFRGLGPVNAGSGVTSVLYRTGNCLGI